MLNERNIFLIDGLGAIASAIVTGAVLPQLSPWTGIPPSLLNTLVSFPILYASYSLSCFFKVKAIKPWMLTTIIVANLFYCALSSFFILELPNLKFWGRLFLGSEIVIILAIVGIEILVHRKSFGKN